MGRGGPDSVEPRAGLRTSTPDGGDGRRPSVGVNSLCHALQDGCQLLDAGRHRRNLQLLAGNLSPIRRYRWGTSLPGQANGMFTAPVAGYDGVIVDSYPDNLRSPSATVIQVDGALQTVNFSRRSGE